MASEIRANKQTNRAGLGTVTYTDTGIIVSGIVTANSFEGDGSSLTGIDATALKDSSGNVKIQAQASGAVHTGFSTMQNLRVTGIATFGTSSTVINGGTDTINVGTALTLGHTQGLQFHTQNLHADGFEINNINASGIITAAQFSGDGSSLSNLPAGAPVGGASTNTVFFENDKAVEVNYQITSGKNAMSAGPISIAAGIAVTVPSGSVWTIV